MRITAWKFVAMVALTGPVAGCDGLNKETPPLPPLADTGAAADTAVDADADTSADTAVDADGSGGVPAFDLGRLVEVSGATYTMGSPDLVGGQREIGRDQDELQHEVVVASFSIMPYEVTQLQWRAAAGNRNPSDHAGCDDCPVESVDWYAAAAFANWVSRGEGLQECYGFSGDCDGPEVWGDGDAECGSVSFLGSSCPGYRLPTEAEWEFAYRAGTSAAYYTGTPTAADDCEPLATRMAWLDCNADETKPVGGREANSLGLFDMGGNVSEWVNDSYGPYLAPSVPAFWGAVDKVYRGGSFRSTAKAARAANRGFGVVMGETLNDIGFRLARAR
jgi:formylglycine-generating enzyme required for sulfatase activity